MNAVFPGRKVDGAQGSVSQPWDPHPAEEKPSDSPATGCGIQVFRKPVHSVGLREPGDQNTLAAEKEPKI